MIRLSSALSRGKRGFKKQTGNRGSWESNEVPGTPRSGWVGAKSPTSQSQVAQVLGFKDAKEMYPVYPLETPPKLFYITLRGNKFPTRCRPSQVATLVRLGLSHGVTHDIMQNTAQNCELLWSVKQYVTIFPVTFPNGEPTPDIDPGRM